MSNQIQTKTPQHDGYVGEDSAKDFHGFVGVGKNKQCGDYTTLLLFRLRRDRFRSE